MRPKAVKVYAPATIANLGSGFDVLGVAIDRPGDVVVARRRREEGLTFSVRAKDSVVPREPSKNVAAHVARLMLDELKPPFGVEMVLHKLMPVGSGLGSSAASSVASVVAINALLQKPLKKLDLLKFAVEGERKAAGAAHADNVAPSLLGSACLVRSYDPLDVIRLDVKRTLVWVVVHPELVVRTSRARAVLPSSVPLKSAIRQWGNVSGLTAGLISGDAGQVGKCVEDVIVEPVRARLVRGFHEVRRAAIQAGAFGCTLSGSGPSVFAVASTISDAKRIGVAMKRVFRRAAGVDAKVFVSRTNMEGAIVLSSGTQ